LRGDSKISGLLTCLTRSRVLILAVRSLRRPGCFRPSDRLAGWDSHPLEIADFHGVLNCWDFLRGSALPETPASRCQDQQHQGPRLGNNGIRTSTRSGMVAKIRFPHGVIAGVDLVVAISIRGETERRLAGDETELASALATDIEDKVATTLTQSDRLA
jgi:hypothetical protein